MCSYIPIPVKIAISLLTLDSANKTKRAAVERLLWSTLLPKDMRALLPNVKKSLPYKCYKKQDAIERADAVRAGIINHLVRKDDEYKNYNADDESPGWRKLRPAKTTQ
jgi:hypothetical protein